MKKLLYTVFFVPTFTFGQSFENLEDVLRWVMGLFNNYFIPLLIAIALLAFFWRNIVALAKKDELVTKAETKWYLFWGIIALFVMVSVWGLVGILADAIGIKNVIPQLNTGSNNGSNLPPCSIADFGVVCNNGDGTTGYGGGIPPDEDFGPDISSPK